MLTNKCRICLIVTIKAKILYEYGCCTIVTPSKCNKTFILPNNNNKNNKKKERETKKDQEKNDFNQFDKK